MSRAGRGAIAAAAEIDLRDAAVGHRARAAWLTLAAAAAAAAAAAGSIAQRHDDAIAFDAGLIGLHAHPGSAPGANGHWLRRRRCCRDRDLRTSMRRCGSARAVSGRSSEMRAGLSMVKDSGSVAGRLVVSTTCRPLPDSGCTSTDCNVLAGGSAAMAPWPASAPSATSSAAAQRRGDGDKTVHSHDLPAVIRSMRARRRAPCSRRVRRERSR